MSKYTKEDIMRMVEEEDVEFIRLQFVDTFGRLKNVAITTNQLEKALNNRTMFDGSAIEGFVKIEESDLYLYPDLDSFVIIPWRPQQGKVARMYCSVHHPDGTPFQGDPRYVLGRVIEQARAEGYRFLIGSECEFFLFHLDDNGRPTTQTHEVAGYFDVAPLDLGENARRDIILTLEEMGCEVEASHHEFAPAQHEIDLHYAEPMEAAETIMTFRLSAKTQAKRHGLYATFLPKPVDGVHGSGMHVNISMVKDGVNAFADEEDPNGLSKEGYYFIGGLMKHIAGMTAILNPIVNSYKRLITGYEAPSEIAWSTVNRSSLIRIPATRGFNTRIELRSPDSTSNPYLALALILAAGMDGIRNKIEPPSGVDENLSKLTAQEKKERGIEPLPATLEEALKAMKEDELVCSVLGDHIVKRFIREKQREWDEYSVQVTNWELQKYLAQF